FSPQLALTPVPGTAKAAASPEVRLRNGRAGECGAKGNQGSTAEGATAPGISQAPRTARTKTVWKVSRIRSGTAEGAKLSGARDRRGRLAKLDSRALFVAPLFRSACE